jgi:hypothetical protein
MSIVQDLYNIFDKEQSKYLEKKSSKNLVVLELSNNLSFLREGLLEKLDDSAIINGLADGQYIKAAEKSIDLNSIQKKTLAKTTYGGVKEFDKYQGWSTDKLINNAYERIDTLKKLNVNKGRVDVNSRLKNLFKYLMVLMAHIKGEELTIKKKQAQ